MFWCGIYLAVAVAVAIAAFVAGNWVRPKDVDAPDHPGTTSAVAGALWPVVIVGITEIMLLGWLTRGGKYQEMQLITAS